MSGGRQREQSLEGPQSRTGLNRPRNGRVVVVFHLCPQERQDLPEGMCLLQNRPTFSSFGCARKDAEGYHDRQNTHASSRFTGSVADM